MPWLIGVIALIVGGAAGVLGRKVLVSSKVQTAETRAQKLVIEAEREAQLRVQQSLQEVKEEIAGMRREAEEDIRQRRVEVKRQEERLARREDGQEQKLGEIQRRDQELRKRDQDLERIRGQLEKAAEQQRRQLEAVARMTTAEAREALTNQVVADAKRAAMGTIREIEQQAREEGEQRARKIVTIAIQRVASEQTAESTVSVFPLPSDDMKGRIIGREGRNIRTFEAVTGVNLIIDDTPEAVVLSCFDPVRREVARLTLEKLVSDGRIHPARIEEVHERSLAEIEERIR